MFNDEKKLEVFKKNYEELTNVLGYLTEMAKKAYNNIVDDKVCITRNDLDYINSSFDSIINSLGLVFNDSIKDSKSNLYTMKFFKDCFDIEIDKIKDNENFKISMILMDIDFFKNVNDSYGHVIGDEIILEISKILKKNTDIFDIVARFGGEEFIFLSFNYSKEDILDFVKKIQKEISENELLLKYKIKLSGGIAFSTKEKNYNKFIKKADELLYKSKNNGRNQFSFEEL
ncbi:MAG: GGDEF domain-containing protein [Candidatus Nanoarchaeia archaeon]|nr:GGDEF domain-containing protein [Candidatus Nanoarchaeia archaeon]